MPTTAYIPFIGRVLQGVHLSHIRPQQNFRRHGREQYMAMMGMTPMTTVFYIGAVAIELAGALSLLSGYQAKAGGWLLFLFLIPTALIVHTRYADQKQLIHFLKNVPMIGGLLYVGHSGAGRYSRYRMDTGHERREAFEPPRRLRKVHQ